MERARIEQRQAIARGRAGEGAAGEAGADRRPTPAGGCARRIGDRVLLQSEFLKGLDRLSNARLARSTLGTSPLAVASVYLHWASPLAATGVRGVSKHDEEAVSFAARQWLDLVSPSNVPLINPEVLEATFAQGGLNFLRGMQFFADDLRCSIAGGRPAGAERFAVGVDVAVTRGKVVFRNRLIELTFVLTSGGHNVGIVNEPRHPRRSYQLATCEIGRIGMDADTWKSETPYEALCDAPGTYVLRT